MTNNSFIIHSVVVLAYYYSGHLATPQDEAEYHLLRQTARWMNPTTAAFWIGVNDVEKEGKRQI